MRTQQYFYGSTHPNGASFRYLVDPKQILKGRAIAVVLIAVYYFSGLFNALKVVIAAVIIFLLVPYILIASMAFRARVSKWQRVRFGFDKRLIESYSLRLYS